jgi:hypothetical protein
VILDLTISGMEVLSFDSEDWDCDDEGWSLNLGAMEDKGGEST